MLLAPWRQPDLIAAVLGAGDVACLLMRCAAPGDALIRGIVEDLSPAVRRHDTALLIESPADARLAARLGVDGVQVRGGGEPLATALESLKPERIVGAADIRSRDDAMTVGESDVDYLMFGEPRPDGWTPPFDQVVERCRWWAELFNVPCVGYAPAVDDVASLAATGAEFVALGDAVWSHAEGPEAAVRRAQAMLLDAALPGGQ